MRVKQSLVGVKESRVKRSEDVKSKSNECELLERECRYHQGNVRKKKKTEEMRLDRSLAGSVGERS